MNEDTGTDETGRDETDDDDAVDRGSRLALDLIVTALVLTATLLLAGSLLAAFGQFDRLEESSDKMRLLGNSANPVTALLALAAVSVVVVSRFATGEDRRTWAATAAAALATVIGLLAVNGVISDFSQEGSGMIRLGSVLLRLGTVVLCGATLWLWFALTGGPTAGAGEDEDEDEDDDDDLEDDEDEVAAGSAPPAAGVAPLADPQE